MPRKYLMTWEPAPRRWKKIHRGVRHLVTCFELGAPPTKEDSYQQANAWWRDTLATIASRPQPHSDPTLRDELTRRRDWARANNRPTLATELDRRVAISDREDDGGSLLLPPDLEARLDGLRQLGLVIPEGLDALALHAVLGEGARWEERLASPPPAGDRTYGPQIVHYLDYQLARQRGGQISVSDYSQTRQALEAFREWVGAATPLDALDAARWQAWYLSLLDLTLSKDTKRNRLRRVREFCTWLAEMGVLAAPGNLHRRFRFKGSKNPVVTFPDEDVRRLFEASPGQLKLHVALGINCGFYPIDISDLRRDEVDFEAGRIIRKRSKTHEQEAVPTVNYPLWPVTLVLLRRFAAENGDRLLLTESGKPWVRDSVDDQGVRSRVNAVQSNYVHVKKRLGFRKPFMALRATAATVLERHPEHARYAQHFLGQAASDIARRHYVVPSQDRFDVAVRWLGEQFGF